MRPEQVAGQITNCLRSSAKLLTVYPIDNAKQQKVFTQWRERLRFQMIGHGFWKEIYL